MKMKWFLAAILILLLGLFAPTILISNIVSAVSNQPIQNEVDLAQETGQVWLNKIANTIPELQKLWKGAQVVKPQPYVNLDNEVNVYLFSIINNTSVVGNMVVGSSLYDYSILEASEVSPPSIPEADVVASALEQNGMIVNKAQINKPTKFIFLGPHRYYAIYNINHCCPR